MDLFSKMSLPETLHGHDTRIIRFWVFKYGRFNKGVVYVLS